MTVEELTNIFLRLEIADKAKDSEFLFGSSEEGVDPFPITGVILDDEGDVCLEGRCQQMPLIEDNERNLYLCNVEL